MCVAISVLTYHVGGFVFDSPSRAWAKNHEDGDLTHLSGLVPFDLSYNWPCDCGYGAVIEWSAHLGAGGTNMTGCFAISVLHCLWYVAQSGAYNFRSDGSLTCGVFNVIWSLMCNLGGSAYSQSMLCRFLDDQRTALVEPVAKPRNLSWGPMWISLATLMAQESFTACNPFGSPLHADRVRVFR